jgi:hypothetical protein
MGQEQDVARLVASSALVEGQVEEGERSAAVLPESGGAHQARLPQTKEVEAGRLAGPKAMQQVDEKN